MSDFDLSGLFAQAQKIQSDMMEAQQRAAEAVVTGSAGGEAVRISLTGGLDATSVSIDPSVIDPSDPDLLADLVLAALRDALEQVAALHDDAGPDMGGLDLGALDMGGLDLGGLLGGLGGGLPGAEADDDTDDDTPGPAAG